MKNNLDFHPSKAKHVKKLDIKLTRVTAVADMLFQPCHFIDF